MKAAYVTQLGPADAIQVGELPTPTVGPTDVLVRTTALAVNNVDLFVRSGAYRTPVVFPFVVGRDLVGTVAEVGVAVDGFAPGDRVWCNSMGHGGRQGSFAEYVSVPRDRLYRLPDGVEDTAAAAVLHPAATAYLGLFREARLRYGDTVVVSGAAGGVGSAVVQLAAAAGANVVAVARADDADWCRGCGASEVVDYRDPDRWTALAAATPSGVDVYVECSTHNVFDQALPLLAHGGRYILIAGLGTTATLPVGELYVRDASVRGFAISNASVTDLADAASAVNRGLASGILRARIADRLPLDQAAEAHRRQESGTRGRLVVLP